MCLPSAGDATSTDATIKGIRASVKEHGRAGIISDEIATAHAVTSGRDTKNCGLHYGNKEKMCTWLAACPRVTVGTAPRTVVTTSNDTEEKFEVPWLGKVGDGELIVN